MSVPSKKIAVGAVPKGFELKSAVLEHLTRQNHSVLDLGCCNADVLVKYPSVGQAVAHALYVGDADFGVVLCNYGTSGIAGVSKFQGVCACSCESIKTAVAARKINGANVLCMGASVVTSKEACEIVEAFINAEFLDIPNVPQKLQDFRKEAREQLLVCGEIPQSRELQMLN